jgi:hypothetical protein
MLSHMSQGLNFENTGSMLPKTSWDNTATFTHGFQDLYRDGKVNVLEEMGD